MNVHFAKKVLTKQKVGSNIMILFIKEKNLSSVHNVIVSLVQNVKGRNTYLLFMEEELLTNLLIAIYSFCYCPMVLSGVNERHKQIDNVYEKKELYECSQCDGIFSSRC